MLSLDIRITDGKRSLEWILHCQEHVRVHCSITFAQTMFDKGQEANPFHIPLVAAMSMAAKTSLSGNTKVYRIVSDRHGSRREKPITTIREIRVNILRDRA